MLEAVGPPFCFPEVSPPACPARKRPPSQLGRPLLPLRQAPRRTGALPRPTRRSYVPRARLWIPFTSMGTALLPPCLPFCAAAATDDADTLGPHRLPQRCAFSPISSSLTPYVAVVSLVPALAIM